MTLDDLFARAIMDSQLIRNGTALVLERQLANTREALRSALLEMADVRAVISEDRRRRAERGRDAGGRNRDDEHASVACGVRRSSASLTGCGIGVGRLQP
jgi:hypothetical protein